MTGIKGATARLRNPRTIRLGESVMVFGFPLAGSLSSGGNFTSGLVSALRGLRDTAGEIQITAPVQPGNSGGPLMDASGLVVGVVQAKLDALKAAIVTGDIPQNVNFAVSLEVLVDFLAKNRVAFVDGSRAATLDSARVGELAQGFTYRVECRGRSQQVKTPPSTTTAPTIPKPDPRADDSALWETVKDSDSIAELQVYLDQFPSGIFAGVARARIKNLTSAKTPTDSPLNTRQSHLPQCVGLYSSGTWTNCIATHTYGDGERYVGERKGGMRHGEGITYAPDGSVRARGIWENGFFLRGQ